MSDERQSQPDVQVVISVVSHGHARELHGLLDTLREVGHPRLSVVVTANLGEDLSFADGALDGRVRVLHNRRPRGFGANHNAAYEASEGDVFCVCNPDVRVEPGTLTPLLDVLRDPRVGVAAPTVRTSCGELQDSARKDLTPGRVLARLWRRRSESEYELDGARPIRPDWVAGMFMAFRWDAFAAVGGFDPGFFLYCEDADICRRLRRAGLSVELVPAAEITHDAQRSSHRSLRHLAHHVRSLARYWLFPLDRKGRRARKPAGPEPSANGAESSRI